ncbi:MAG TPA: iron ABC transporter permease [Mycobacteriales bacterium]|nr:iron ABC transporter permease [Mycobacteriales bacterium]
MSPAAEGAPPRARRSRAPALLVVPALGVAAAALLPIGYLGVRASEHGPAAAAEILFRGRTAALLGRSTALALSVTAASVALGVLLAWLTVRCRMPGGGAWAVLAALPLAIPTYVAGFAYISRFPSLAGFRGAWLVLTLYSYPYVYLPVAGALRGLDPALEEASRSLGVGAWRTFTGVTLRQLRPAIAAGSLLVTLYVFSDFGAVSLMRFDAFTRVIYSSYQSSFDRTPAAVLGALLVVVTVLIVVAEGRSRGRSRYARTGRGAPRPGAPVDLGRWRWPATLLTATVAAFTLGVPGVTLGIWLQRGISAGQSFASTGQAAIGSLTAASLGAVVTVAAAVPVALLAARYRSPLASAVERASYAGHALPGLVIALSLVFFATRYADVVYQRLPLLVFAYFVLFLPLAVGAVHASAVQAPPVLDDVARSLGSGTWRVLRTVTAPLTAPGVAAGAALVFLTCLKELPATLLLRPSGFETLSVRVWEETGAGEYAAAAPPAALLVLVAAVPTWLLTRRRGLS